MIDFIRKDQIDKLMSFINLHGLNYFENSDDDKIINFLKLKFDSVIYINDPYILHPSELLGYLDLIGSQRLFFLHQSFFAEYDIECGLFVEKGTKQNDVEKFLENKFVEQSSNDSNFYYPIYTYIASGLFIDLELSLLIHFSTYLEAAYLFSPNKQLIENLAMKFKDSKIEYGDLLNN